MNWEICQKFQQVEGRISLYEEEKWVSFSCAGGLGSKHCWNDDVGRECIVRTAQVHLKFCNIWLVGKWNCGFCVSICIRFIERTRNVLYVYFSIMTGIFHEKLQVTFWELFIVKGKISTIHINFKIRNSHYHVEYSFQIPCTTWKVSWKISCLRHDTVFNF